MEGDVTVLDELEPVFNVALVSGEEETAAVHRLAGRVLGGGDFGSELDAATDDAAVLERCADGGIFEVGAGVGLAGVRGEGAAVLRGCIVGEGVAEVVVAVRVSA